MQACITFVRGTLSAARVSHDPLSLVHEKTPSKSRKGPSRTKGSLIQELLWKANLAASNAPIGLQSWCKISMFTRATALYNHRALRARHFQVAA